MTEARIAIGTEWINSTRRTGRQLSEKQTDFHKCWVPKNLNLASVAARAELEAASGRSGVNVLLSSVNGQALASPSPVF